MTNFHHNSHRLLLVFCITIFSACSQTLTIQEHIYAGNDAEALALIKSGKNINTRDRWGNTPLHLVSIQGRIDFAKALVEQGADINARAFRGRTPVMLALRHGHNELAMYYLSQGAELETRYKQTNILIEAVMAGNADMVSYLIDQGYDVDTVNGFNVSALHFAAMQGNLAIVDLLISKGADINLESSNGWTALHFAAYNNQMAIVDMLLDKRIEPLMMDVDGAAAYASGVVFEQIAKRRQSIYYRRQAREFYRKAANAYKISGALYKDYAKNIDNDIVNIAFQNSFAMSVSAVLSNDSGNNTQLYSHVPVPQKSSYSLESLKAYYQGMDYQSSAGYKRCMNATR